MKAGTSSSGRSRHRAHRNHRSSSSKQSHDAAQHLSGEFHQVYCVNHQWQPPARLYRIKVIRTTMPPAEYRACESASHRPSSPRTSFRGNTSEDTILSTQQGSCTCTTAHRPSSSEPGFVLQWCINIRMLPGHILMLGSPSSFTACENVSSVHVAMIYVHVGRVCLWLVLVPVCRERQNECSTEVRGQLPLHMGLRPASNLMHTPPRASPQPNTCTGCTR